MSTNSMQALWLENNTLAVRNVPVSQKVDEALIKVNLAGICGTDLELVKGYYPFTGILGHEFVGEVVQAETAGWEGKRVVGEINAACGQCQQCHSLRLTHCENRSVLGIINRQGVFAEYVRLPVENLHLVPEDVTDEEAVFTEPLAAALQIQQQVHIRPEERVLLIGAGRLGQLIAQTLKLTGCHLSVVARHGFQKEILIKQGIHLLDESEVQPARWDVVVEATGSPSGFELARRAVRPQGKIILKSTYKGKMEVDFSSLVVEEIALIGSRCGPFEPALRLLQSKQVDPRLLIFAEYPLKEAIKAFQVAESAGVMKVLLRP